MINKSQILMIVGSMMCLLILQSMLGKTYGDSCSKPLKVHGVSAGCASEDEAVHLAETKAINVGEGKCNRRECEQKKSRCRFADDGPEEILPVVSTTDPKTGKTTYGVEVILDGECKCD